MALTSIYTVDEASELDAAPGESFLKENAVKEENTAPEPEQQGKEKEDNAAPDRAPAKNDPDYIPDEELTPQVRKRIDGLFKTTHETTEALRQQFEINKTLVAQLEQVKGKLSNLDDFQKNYTTEQEAAQENYIKSLIKQAYDDGDFNTAQQLNDKLIDIKLSKALKQQQQQTKAPVEEKKPVINDPIFAPEKVEVVTKFTEERSTDGTYLRPWLRKEHPRFGAAVQYMNGIMSDNETAALPFDEQMRRLDSLMGLKRTAMKQPPPTAGMRTTRPPSANDDTLTSAELNMANRLGVSPKEYAAVLRAGKTTFTSEDF